MEKKEENAPTASMSPNPLPPAKKKEKEKKGGGKGGSHIIQMDLSLCKAINYSSKGRTKLGDLSLTNNQSIVTCISLAKKRKNPKTMVLSSKEFYY